MSSLMPFPTAISPATMDEMQLDEPDIAFPTFSTAKTAMIRGRSQQPGTSSKNPFPAQTQDIT